ncbi:hypothetical protein KVR01_003124 [Diaporthe batatas]|uniref:uncharacterized protein n=1 Tax=Diaporthe batatas TaxID=748121 RepID=UPI001D0450CF|nr:uncharacterized protein KVR01_003124 [Diaporthe batatas]KAG8167435.1 hypothetical protein KVR01_003124 [Diaporthe batatas]
MQSSRNTLSAWYTSGSDTGHYASALEACRKSRLRLTNFEMTAEEEAIVLRPPTDGNEVKVRIEFVLMDLQKREKRPAWLEKTRNFFQGFCKVIDKTSALVQPMLPQSAEYTVTFGLLVLLFRAVVTKSDREEALMEHLDKLSAKLPVIDFYNTTFPTAQMKFTISKVYAEVMGFFDNALTYYHGGRLAKLADALFRTKPKFEESITTIEKEVNKMLDLKNVAHEAQTADIQVIVTKMEQDIVTLLQDGAQKSQADDIQKILNSTGKDLLRLQDSMQYIGTAASFGLETLHQRMIKFDSTMTQMQMHSMITHAQGLQDVVIASDPDSYWDADEALARLSARGFRLSEKDRWENNGILDHLLEWSKASGPILWIGGSCGNQETWVTELSLDIAHVLLSHRINVVYIFCSDFMGCSQTLTPKRLVQILICQLLDMHPEIAYGNPSYFSLTRLRNTKTFSGMWHIFERLVMSLGEVFILIDRVEACAVDDDADLRNDLIPSIMKLAGKSRGVRGIITSEYEAPEQTLMEQVYIDTGRRPGIAKA